MIISPNFLTIWATLLCEVVFNGSEALPAPDRDECDAGLTCLPLSQCSLSQNEYETSFPCSSHGDAVVKICCPVAQIGKLDNRGGDAIIKPTTPKPKTTTAYTPFTLENQWDNVPANLKDKLKLLPEDCGRLPLGDRIVNGMEANIGDYPWMALIGYTGKRTTNTVFLCGGSLISSRYVLTAAHCAKPEDFSPSIIRLGEWNLKTEKDCQKVSVGADDCSDPVVDVPIEKFIVHELFGNRSFPLLRFDIALIRLATEVTFTDFIQPICLSSKTHQNPKHSYTVSGWGVTDNELMEPSPILQFVHVKLYDFYECGATAPAEVSPLLRTAQFCAGGVNGEDACRGDSGGPLSFDSLNREYLKGIVSLATSQECGREGKPTVYTEVTAFIKWILRNMEP